MNQDQMLMYQRLYDQQIAQIKEMARFTEQSEQTLEPPNQALFNQLYSEIHCFVQQAMETAQSAGKPCLFILGEFHPVLIGKSSLVIEYMFMHAANQLGIKNLYLEGTREVYESRKQSWATLAANNREYADTLLEVGALRSSLQLTEHFTVIATETSNNFNTDETHIYKTREEQMSEIIAQHGQSGLFICGTHHLMGFMDSKPLQNFHRYPINTIPTRQLTQIPQTYDATTPHLKTCEDFIKNPKLVTQFSVQAKLMPTQPTALLTMVDNSHQRFIAGSLPHTCSPNVLTCPAPDFPAATTPPFRTSPEQFPVAVMLQTGFWLASKFGLCAKPSGNLPPIQFADPLSERLHYQSLRESSVESSLQKQGTSLEQALQYLFGKNYTQEHKEFVVDVLTGETNNTIRDQFYHFANIYNRNLRSKELAKLCKTARDIKLQQQLRWFL